MDGPFFIYKVAVERRVNCGQSRQPTLWGYSSHATRLGCWAIKIRPKTKQKKLCGKVLLFSANKTITQKK